MILQKHKNKNLSSEITILKNIRISNNSVAFRYFEIIAETCLSTNYDKYRKGFKFFLKFIFPKFNFSKKTFLLITDEHSSNYYHWHLFSLRKLLIFKENNLLEKSIIFLPKRYKKYPFVMPSLIKFGVQKKQIVFLRRKSNIKVSSLAITKIPPIDNSLMIGVSNILSKGEENFNSEFGDKIYISREKQVLRFVENEKEVVDLLSKYGFKKIIAEEFSYEDQIKIFSQAKYLVSSHGAGLTNMIFMKRDSSVLEMVANDDKNNQDRQMHYANLSNMLNIKYFYQECKMGEKSKVKDHHHASLVVNLDELEDKIKLMLY